MLLRISIVRLLFIPCGKFFLLKISSPYRPMSEGWLSKRSPPPSYQQERNHSGSVKRKIQLESPDTRVSNSGVGRGEGQPRLSNGGSNVFDIDEDEEDDEEVTFPRFTG